MRTFAIQALQAGKHVYVEKPLAVTLEEGRRILSVAKEKGSRVGSAPETFMGGGIQTCKKLIEDGWIGRTDRSRRLHDVRAGMNIGIPTLNFTIRLAVVPCLTWDRIFDRSCQFARTDQPCDRFGKNIVSDSDDYECSQIRQHDSSRVSTHVAGVLDFKDGAGRHADYEL